MNHHTACCDGVSVDGGWRKPVPGRWGWGGCLQTVGSGEQCASELDVREVGLAEMDPVGESGSGS